MYKKRGDLRTNFTNFWRIFVIFERSFPEGVIIVPKMLGKTGS